MTTLIYLNLEKKLSLYRTISKYGDNKLAVSISLFCYKIEEEQKLIERLESDKNTNDKINNFKFKF